jgi:WD40 repeat protein
MSAAHTNRVNSVTFSLDGQYIVSGSDDRTIRVCGTAW